MTVGGATERVERVQMPREPLFHRGGRRLLIGITVASAIFFLCMLSSVGGFDWELGFGTMALFISMVAVASELSIRGFLYAFPTLISTLAFLSLLK